MKAIKTIMAFIFCISSLLNADVKVNPLFSKNMVLQENAEVPIWGWAEPGEEVTVSGSWGESENTVADKNGKWMVKLSTPVSNDVFTVRIKGKNEINIGNVLLGQVWLCSGQSNMQWILAWSKNAEEAILGSRYPEIRYFHVKRTASETPLEKCEGEWVICDPYTSKDFSAVAYFFGRELFQELRKPIGLINSSFGGTRAETWTPLETLKANPVNKDYLENYEKAAKTYPEQMEKFRRERHEWIKESRKARFKGKKVPRPPHKPYGPGHQNAPAHLYNAMINPLVPFEIKGVIWYQGEANNRNPSAYKTIFPEMIKSWRKLWSDPNMPFYFAQLSDFKGIKPITREAQMSVLSLDNTGMAVTVDIGNPNDIHPRNKEDVGKRLARWALAKDYGKDIVYSGPLYKSHKIEEDKIRIHFKYAGSGLKVKGNKLSEFTIAGSDKEFLTAKAELEGDTVLVWNEKIENPKAVRYGWSNSPDIKLYNGEDLPASPFRTDNWEIKD